MAYTISTSTASQESRRAAIKAVKGVKITRSPGSKHRGILTGRCNSELKKTAPITIKTSDDATTVEGSFKKDEKNPGVMVIDVRVVKWLRTGIDNGVTASLANVQAAPELYPNIELTFDDKGRPIQAREAKLDSVQWATKLKAAKSLVVAQRRKATRLANNPNGVSKKTSYKKRVRKSTKA